MLCRAGCYRPLALVLLGGLLVRPAGAAEGDPLPSLPATPQLKLDIPEVELLQKQSSLDPDVFAYRIAMPKGVRFFVALKEYPAEGQPARSRGYWQFENEADEPVPLTITFSRRNGQGSGLLSQDEHVRVDVEAEHTHRGGFATIVEAPLRDLRPDEKQLVLPETNEDPRALGPGFRRMAIIAKAGVPLDKPEKVFPRAELIVGRVPPEPEPARRPASPATLAARAQWQRQAIGTAYIRFRSFAWLAERFTVRDPGPIREAFLSANLVDHPDRLNAIHERLSGEKPKGNAWSVKEFYGVGLKTREEYVEGPLAGSVHLYDGEFVLDWSDADQQLNVHTIKTSRLARTTLDTFRHLPQGDLAEAEAKDRSDGRLTVADGMAELVLDEATGFVHRLTVVHKGQVGRETLQMGPQEHTGGIVFPRVHVELTHREGKATLIRGTIVEQAEFNEPFPSATFRMSAPANAVVVDLREDNFRPRVGGLSEDVPDVAAWLKKSPVPR